MLNLNRNNLEVAVAKEEFSSANARDELQLMFSAAVLARLAGDFVLNRCDITISTPELCSSHLDFDSVEIYHPKCALTLCTALIESLDRTFMFGDVEDKNTELPRRCVRRCCLL